MTRIHMTFEENQAHQKQLEALLQTLMESELDQKEDLLSKIEELKAIYLDKNGELNGFRHQYSRISSCIFNTINIDTQVPNTLEYLNDSAQILANNLAVIRDEVKNDKNTQLAIPVAKLYDHVNLELLRINYNAGLNEKQDAKLSSILLRIQEQDSSIRDKERDVLSEVDKVKDKINSAQKENVAILAIFAAVIMAFTGGFSFIANSFSGLTSAPIEKILCLALFIGLILTNLLYALLKFVWCIIKKEEESGKIPFSVKTLVIINTIFGISALIFLGISYLNNS